MSSIGRNDPCLCGSGRKYKNCCGSVTRDASNIKYDRIRALDGKSADLVLRYAKRRFGEHVLDDAWGDFLFSDEASFDTGDPESEYFSRWIVFDWRPKDERTLAEFFLSETGQKLDGDIRRFIEATLHSPYSFLQTLEVRRGETLTLRDIFRKREFLVTERSASKALEPGHILFARVVEMDGLFFLLGNGVRIIPAENLDYLLIVRADMEQEEPLVDHTLTDQTLLELEPDLRDVYFDIADELENWNPEIRNTDGDPIAFHTLTYSIPSFGAAFEALKDLEQKPSGNTDNRLLADAERDSSGAPKGLVLHWLKQKEQGKEGNTTLGVMRIDGTSLVVETNSERRCKRIQKEITKRLGAGAVLIRTEVKTHEGIMNELADPRIDKSMQKKIEEHRRLNETPEVKKLLKGMMEKHWDTWPDIPLPALRGMTPRHAARDPVGRELLESLLLDFESQNRRLKKDDSSRVDITKLRRELGLDAGIRK
jgi:hypothetical protein